jgi:hypothetical protein
VVKDIEHTLAQEFCCYGYRNMTGELKEMGWIINHKKVYRLIKHGIRVSEILSAVRSWARLRNCWPSDLARSPR